MNVDSIISIMAVSLNMVFATRSCISDHINRTIPNNICKFLFIINLFSACYFGYIMQSAIITAGIFSILVLTWLIGCFGAGDIKLLCAFSIGIRPELTIACLIMIGVCGGIQLVIVYLVGLATRNNLFEKGIPYGIPISISGVVFTALSFLSF